MFSEFPTTNVTSTITHTSTIIQNSTTTTTTEIVKHVSTSDPTPIILAIVLILAVAVFQLWRLKRKK